MRAATTSVVFLVVIGCTPDPADTGDSGAVDGTPCVWTATSTLAGAALTGGDASCDWALSTADAGVDVPWTLTVTEAQELRVDNVSCVAVDDSGLRFFEYVSDDPAGASPNTWCPRCDVGICPVDDAVYTTVVGTWAQTFTWRPRQWQGPSDYGATPGDLLSAGDYQLVVRAAGTMVADGTPWQLRLSAPLTLHD